MYIIKLVEFLHKILAIPYLKSPDNPTSTYRKVYCFLLMLGVIYLSIWQLSGKFGDVYPIFKPSIVLLDIMVCILIAFFDIYDNTVRIFLNEKQFCRFYQKLKRIDQFLGLSATKSYFFSGIAQYKTSIITMHVIVFATFCSDLYSNTAVMGWHVHKYNMANFVLKYKFTWFVVHLHMSANAIRQRFCLLNARFHDIIRYPKCETHILNYMKCHMLCGLIEFVNDTYSFQILILEKIIALHVIETTCLCLWFAPENFNVVTFLNNFVWSVDFMVSFG